VAGQGKTLRKCRAANPDRRRPQTIWLEVEDARDH